MPSCHRAGVSITVTGPESGGFIDGMDDVDFVHVDIFQVGGYLSGEEKKKEPLERERGGLGRIANSSDRNILVPEYLKDSCVFVDIAVQVVQMSDAQMIALRH